MKSDFYNINLDITDQDSLMESCIHFFSSDKPFTIFFLNAHCFNIAQNNIEYRNAINKSDLLLNDGIGIKLASVLSGIRIKENLNGTDLIPKILTLAAKEGKKIYFLGGMEGVAEKAAFRIKDLISGIQIAGYHSGFFNYDEEKIIINDINDSGSELLVLGMGVPKQELWADRNKDLLVNVKIIIAGGAILDFISGKIKRAPLWIRKLHMEWLFRLNMEPGRMWKRYCVGNIVFFHHLFKIKFKKVQKNR